jgi:putative transposase
MREWQSQTHVRWYCRYHVVIVPKYRKKAIYGVLRKDILIFPYKDFFLPFGINTT